VWVGNDDNTPNAGLSGGGLPARIWRDVMMQGLRVGGRPEPTPVATEIPEDEELDAVGDLIDNAVLPIEGEIEGLGLNVRVGRDGSIEVNRGDREPDEPPPTGRDGRDRPRERPEGE
jgi:penicillin-binding protein 1A